MIWKMSSEKEATIKSNTKTYLRLNWINLGKGRMKMGDSIVQDVEVISSGSLGLDVSTRVVDIHVVG